MAAVRSCICAVFGASTAVLADGVSTSRPRLLLVAPDATAPLLRLLLLRSWITRFVMCAYVSLPRNAPRAHCKRRYKTRSCQSAHATATFSTATRRLCPFKMKFQCLCFGQISPNFDLYKGFFMEKKDPKSPNFQEKFATRQIIFMVSSSR